MIKAVIFDIDNTLYDYIKGHELGMRYMSDYAEKELGMPAGMLEQENSFMFREILEEMDWNNADIHNRPVRFQRILEKWKKPLFPHVLELIRLYDKGTLEASQTPYEGVPEFLSWAKERGMVLGIGTDMTAYQQMEKLQVMGVGPYFDFLLTSEEAAVEKPHPLFFEKVMKKVNYFLPDTLPEECIFIGDNVEKDVRGACACGMNGVWYQPDCLAASPEGVSNRISYYRELQSLILKFEKDA